MRKQYTAYLSDPLSGQPLELTILEEKGEHITAGYLSTNKSTHENWYPIINGIPRLMVKELKLNLLQQRHLFFQAWKNKLPAKIANEWQKAIDQIKDLDAFMAHQKKTAESFAFEWKTIYKENNYEKQNFFHFLSPYIKENDLKNTVSLDIGCGSGRFTKQAALAGAKVAFGSDLGESVEVAYELTKDLQNACIVQADIYAMPFKGNIDVAFSIGVLHHLPKPQEGFSALPPILKKDGKMLIWVYSRRHNARAIYFYEPLRAVLKNLPPKLLLLLCYLPASIVHLINGLTHALNGLGCKKLAKKVPFAYYANFPFNMKLNDAFDVLATPKSNYYFSQEIVHWFNSAKLNGVAAYEHPEAGITCVGTYGG